MKYVLIYESPADLDLERLRAVFPEHRARWSVFREEGTLLLIKGWNEALLDPI